jgi:hypothetical protein
MLCLASGASALWAECICCRLHALACRMLRIEVSTVWCGVVAAVWGCSSRCRSPVSMYAALWLKGFPCSGCITNAEFGKCFHVPE